MQTYLEIEFLNNPLRTWLIAGATAVAVYIGLHFVQRLVLRYMSGWSRRTTTNIDDLLQSVLASTRIFFLLFVSLFAATRVLFLTPDLTAALETVAVVVFVLQLAFWGNALITGLVKRELDGRAQTDPGSAMTLNALAFLGRLVLWSVLLLMGLENLGVDVTALLTGLGIGGIAVALAVQNVLGDLLGSLSIVLDKPFVIGDFIVIDDKSGTVEKIGLKTSRLRALSGEQLIFANSDLLTARIQNFKRMYERRIAFTIGVTYATPRAQIEAVPGIIRTAVEAQEQARFDRSHFASYGDSALNFETVYYVTIPDYGVYMDVQQNINLLIHEAFEAAGIEFAYPTQTLLLQRAAKQPGRATSTSS